jgi:hypothetical protein
MGQCFETSFNQHLDRLFVFEREPFEVILMLIITINTVCNLNYKIKTRKKNKDIIQCKL